MSPSHCCRVFCIAILASGFVSTGRAQSTFGSFVGTVRDPAGSMVARCAVSAVNRGTAVRRVTLTDDTGAYVLVNLEPGSYDLSFQASGFHVTNHSSVQLLARQTVRVDANLTLASQTETVNVMAAAESVITTEVSNIAETKTGKELFDLPIAIGSRARAPRVPSPP